MKLYFCIYISHLSLATESQMDQMGVVFGKGNERVVPTVPDINGFEPVTLEEMIRNNRKFKQENAVPADIEQT